jgi:hypothetical protein
MDANDPICVALTTTIEKKSYPLTTLLTPPFNNRPAFSTTIKYQKRKCLNAKPIL